MPPNIEVIAADNNKCGEGPIWDQARQRLLWTDIDGGLVYSFEPSTGNKQIINRGILVGAIALDTSGQLVFAARDGLYLCRAPDDCTLLARQYDGLPLEFNDGIADPQGRYYAGTMHWGEQGMIRHGRLYLIHTDGTIEPVEEGIELSNGLGFSPDNRTLYFTDSTARNIYAYDVNPISGHLSNRRTLVTIPDDEGIPDGMTVDAEGYLWSAQWYGAQVVRYDPQGKVERRLAMPIQQPSCCAFGGPEMDELYITSASVGWPSKYAPPSYDPHASNIGGSLYRVRVGIVGKPEHRTDLSRAAKSPDA